MHINSNEHVKWNGKNAPLTGSWFIMTCTPTCCKLKVLNRSQCGHHKNEGGKTRHVQSGCLLLVHASHTHFGWSNGWGTTLFWEWNKETIIYTWLSLTWKPPLKTTFTFKTNLNKVTTTTKLSANCVSYVTIITSNHPYAWRTATHEMQTLFVLNLSSFNHTYV